MTSNLHSVATWLQPVNALVRAGDHQGGFFVALPEYRPDLVQQMALDLDLAFFDFRAEVMLPLGWDAAHLALGALSDTIALRTADRGLVVHNAEALLATKQIAERCRWLRQFISRAWPHPAIIPIAVYQNDLPSVPERTHRINPDAIPPERLLTRLATR